MSFIIFSASGYEASSTMRPLTSCHEVLPTRMWRKISTQSMILLMTSGGFRRALSELMSFGVMEFNASRAASSAGLAASRSRSASSFVWKISLAFFVTRDTMLCTLRRSTVASAVLSSISAMSVAISRLDLSSTTCFSSSSTFILST